MAAQGRSVSTLGLFGIWLGFAILVAGLSQLLGQVFGWGSVDYANLADSSESILRHLIAPDAVVALVVIALVSFLGWWAFVARDDRSVPRRMLVVPATIVVLSLAVADWSRLADLGAGYAPTLAVATLLVGFNEEVMFRGVLLHGFRQTGSEVHAWAWSTGLFALVHSANLFLGSPVQAVVSQLFITFMLGSLFYITRRATGGIIVPILVHALYDFALFSHGGSEGDIVPGGGTATLQLSNLVPLVVLVLFIVVMIAHKQWMHPEQDEDAATNTGPATVMEA